MSPSRGTAFGSFGKTKDFKPNGVKPITTEFSKGSVQGSIATINRESAWTRWRRGFELATALSINNNYEYSFNYQIPLPPGTTQTGTNPPTIPGVFQGFPTVNKEFGMHWAGTRVAGSLRLDNIRSSRLLSSDYWPNIQFEDYENEGLLFDDDTRVSSQLAYIESVTEDADYWYVKLAGNWSTANPLPPPLYVPVPGVPGGIKAINGEILEDRIITQGGVPITRDTIDPLTQKRYGYTQAVLADTDPFTGILKLRKQGSVEATPDRLLITPATRPPTVGRFLMTGTRYCCSCQDFTRRDYAYMTNLNNRAQRYFPRTNLAALKPGRYEIMKDRSGRVDNRAMTSATENRNMTVVSPSAEYNIPPSISPNSSTEPGANRDNPGVFRDFGSVYLRNNNPSLPGSRADGMPTYEDYSAVGNVITSLTDTWTPLLDEVRYCKHIYALKFKEGVFPPEPSDFPVDIGSMVAWEQKLVTDTEEKQEKINRELAYNALAYMDVPPYNCQAPMMMPMMQKLFNVPSTFVRMQGFTMYDKNGAPYVPSLGEKPGT
jgi:hypothetical protein